MEIGFEVCVHHGFDEAVEHVIAALKSEGFGVLTRIDIHKVMKEKLGEEFRSYVILGACNPTLSYKALTTDPTVGLMLPCNVTVEADPNGDSLVRIVNPEAMMKVGELEGNPIVQEVATEARLKLERVAEALLE